MFGLLNLDKPPGWTSRDVVNRVQRMARTDRVGHAGTLDPLATGVLVVCVGPATRLASYVQRYSKTYRAEFLLGCTSETDDIEGDVQPLPAAPALTAEQVRAALPRFCGRILQTPPVHSAVKVQGRRAYDLARSGQAVELEPREVEIHRLALRNWTSTSIGLEVECGSGTYIRSLGRDLARSVGSDGVMRRLRRTRIGPFVVEDALPMEDLTPAKLQTSLLPARLATAMLPQASVDATAVADLRAGRQTQAPAGTLPAAEVAAVSPTGELIAICAATSAARLAPRIVFASDG